MTEGLTLRKGAKQSAYSRCVRFWDVFIIPPKTEDTPVAELENVAKQNYRKGGSRLPLSEKSFMGRAIKKIWNVITGLLVAAVVVLAIALAGVRLVGFQVFTVLSGSMEPTYHVGSLIYVKSVDYKELQSGDVITFMLDEDTVATHRVVKVVPDEDDPEVLRYRTKGDANDAEDGGLVHYKNIIGSPVFTIPYLGYFADYIQNPPGTYVAISAGAILLLLVFLPDLFSSDDKEKEEKKRRERDKVSL